MRTVACRSSTSPTPTPGSGPEQRPDAVGHPDVRRLGQPAPDQPRHRQRGHALRLQHPRRCAAHPDDERGPQDRARQERLPRPRRQALPLPGHEIGPRGYVTRINLDESDPLKRVTLISDTDTTGNAYPTIDGITWDPFTRQLLLTAESSSPKGGVFGVSLDANGDPVDGGTATRLNALGSGGFEGIQNDADGNVWLVEDIGGKAASGGKAPNSFVYRFVPPTRATSPRAASSSAPDPAPRRLAATTSQLQANPSTRSSPAPHYGSSFATKWVTIHTGTTEAFDATAAAKAADATPLKRPENGVFRPGTGFKEFYFTETGDTSTSSTLPGAYGGVFRISQKSASADTGRISIAASATRSTPASTTSPSPRRTTSSSSRTPATASTPSATPWTPVTSSTSVTVVRVRGRMPRARLRSPSRPVPRRGP